jgi:hypothetical protein
MEFLRSMRRIGVAAVLLCLVTDPAATQTVYDLDSIEPDAKIIGSQYGSIIHKAVILDIDQSGVKDLFLRDAAVQMAYGGYCVFGYLDFTNRHGTAVVDLAAGDYDIVIVGVPLLNNKFGFSLATGDWNNDGVDDLAVGDPHASPWSHGMVNVFWGGSRWQPGTVLYLAQTPSDITISISDPTTEPWLGYNLASADLNDDGIDDLAIGAIYDVNQTVHWAGAVHVLYGSESFSTPLEIDLSNEPADLSLHGKWNGDRFGESLAVGDLNGDQVDDLVVGAREAWISGSGGGNFGAMYVFFGSDSFPPHHRIDLSEVDADVTVLGSEDDASFGQCVASGDFNGDGLDDMCGGEEGHDGIAHSGVGAAFTVWGRDDFPPGAVIDLRDEQADLSFIGEDIYGGGLGLFVSAGDLDGDGLDELSLHSWQTSDDAEVGSGAQSIFLGTSEYPPNHVVDFSKMYPTMRILGDDYHDGGLPFSMIEDLDGDGRNDILVGYGMANRPEAEGCGEICIFYNDGLPIDRPPRIMAGPGPDGGNPPELRLWDPFCAASGWSGRFVPFLTRGFGLNPAAGDLDGDGYDEIIAGPGPGPYHPATVRVLDETGALRWQFQGYGTPRYGVNVAAGDLDGNGDQEIVTGAGPGAVYGPHVRGWTLSGDQVVPLGNVSFLAYGTRRWGVNVACGDIDGDGFDEIVTGAGPGDVFGPHVRGWNVDGGSAVPIGAVSYLAYGTPRWGVNVSCGDIDGDGIDEIVTGPGPSELFGSHIRGWNYDGKSMAPIPGVNFFAFADIACSMGCVVNCGDLDNDGIDELLTTPGPHSENPARLKSWNYDGEVLAQIDRMSFLLFEEGEYVAGARLASGNFYQYPPFLP